MLNFRLFSLHPEIFESFLRESLVARARAQKIIDVEIINWRQKFGLGSYKQVDDRPYGGGSGMVLQVEPIYNALKSQNAVSKLFKANSSQIEHKRLLPPNQDFFEYWQKQKPKQATISLTPRGFTLNQSIVQWLASNFDTLNILCGRYEGFDARVSEIVDLELSLGDFVLNGGEVAAMAFIEAVGRLRPGFVTKDTSVLHDSFSSDLNDYIESEEFVIGKRKLAQKKLSQEILGKDKNQKLFDNQFWKNSLLPYIEHPQYSRPSVWQNLAVPEILLEGNHKKIQAWRHKWW